MTMPSELSLFEGKIQSCDRYLAFLNDAESHRLLRKDVSIHLWKQMKLHNAMTKLDNFEGLLSAE